MELIYRDEVFAIVGAAMAVHRELGEGFLEPIYQEALAVELKLQGIPFEREKELAISYKGEQLKKYYKADFICYGKIIVELKALSALSKEHKAQVINYLKATHIHVGLLINFGETSLKYERIVRTQQ